ncbi:MAG TPA: MBL fold metallo-hydrolase [Firmicutes bacterium]|nr:MBL fold metallo-hydrolase [Bacillota bacterium]
MLRRRFALAVLLMLALALGVFGGAITSREATAPLVVHFIDVGQGDSILIRSPSGRTMLVDGGEPSVGHRLVGFLRDKGVTKLDYVVSTHPHADHIGGLIDVLREFPVGRVYDSGKAHTTQTYEDYLLLIERKDIPFELARAGKSIDLGDGVKVLVLWPKDPLPTSINDASVVIRLTYGKVSVLLTGDAESAVERALLASRKEIASQILKVAHHGSSSSCTGAFLGKVKPVVAVISVGAGNRYGHPSDSTLKALALAGAKVYRTDQNGTVTIRSDGERYVVEVETQASPRSPPAGGCGLAGTGETGTGQGKGTRYYASIKSNKFHYPSCRYAKQISASSLIVFNSREEAIAAGYVPCKVCRP